MIIQYSTSKSDFHDLSVGCEGAWDVFLANKSDDTLSAVMWDDNGNIVASWFHPKFDPFQPDLCE